MLIVFLAGKLIIYSVWCYVGMRLFQSPRLFTIAYVSPFDSTVADSPEQSSGTAPVKQALGLGFFRLALGLVFGGVAILVAGFVVPARASTFDRGVLAYALFLVPVRALEWWITARIIGKTSASAHVFWWIFGGVVLSCLADIPTGFAAVGLFGGLC